MRGVPPGVLVLLLALGACERDGNRAPASPGAPVDATTSTVGATGSASADGQQGSTAGGDVLRVAEGVKLPGGRLGEQLTWVITTLNGRGPDAGSAAEHFADSFLEQVPADQVGTAFAQIRGLGPLTITSLDAQPDSLSASLQASPALVLQLALDSDGRIAGFAVTPDPLADREPAGTYQELQASVDAIADDNHVLAAQVDDGTCRPVYEHAGDQPAPSGSMVKLFVLSAVVDAVQRGDLSWEQELTVTRDVKSLPSGRLQDAADGTKVSVRQAAELMVSISDNTATDLLIDAVGVEQVEASIDGMGLGDARGLLPLLSTKQFFTLGWHAPGSVREQWAQADTRGQRAILADLDVDVSGIDPLTVTEPRWQDGIGWSVSAQDLCTVHLRLQEQAATPDGEPVREILALNPGLPSAAEPFDYLGFKGGGAPGVVGYSFYGERPDGSAVVAVLQVASEQVLPPNATVGPVSDLLALLADG